MVYSSSNKDKILLSWIFLEQCHMTNVAFVRIRHDFNEIILSVSTSQLFISLTNGINDFWFNVCPNQKNFCSSIGKELLYLPGIFSTVRSSYLRNRYNPWLFNLTERSQIRQKAIPITPTRGKHKCYKSFHSYNPDK